MAVYVRSVAFPKNGHCHVDNEMNVLDGHYEDKCIPWVVISDLFMW